jgi:hypothetical protein
LNDEDQAVVSQAAVMVVFQLSKKKKKIIIVKSANQRTVASVRRGRFSRNSQLSSGSQQLHTTGGKIKATFHFYSKCICDWRVNNYNSNNNNK